MTDPGPPDGLPIEVVVTFARWSAVQRLLEVYTAEGCDVWLESPNRNLGGRSPMDLFYDRDPAPVFAEIDRLRTGGNGE